MKTTGAAEIMNKLTVTYMLILPNCITLQYIIMFLQLFTKYIT